MAFLTKLDRPKMWEGYPFLLSAVIGTEDSLYMDVKSYTASGSMVAHATSTSTAYENKVVNFNVTEIYGAASLTSVEYFLVYLVTDLGEILTDSFRIDFVASDDICDNPILLMGRNSLGGVLTWMFDYNQEYGFDFSNKIKSKRLTLTTSHLTLNEWESLQDFITLGEEYRISIIEFTSSTIMTSARVGQQLYVVDTDGNKVGVNIVPSRSKTFTRYTKHTLELEIEYPETFAL
jgi:hypothetical protein